MPAAVDNPCDSEAEDCDEVIMDINAEVAVFIFNDLEHYLIEKLERPIFNKRC